MFARAVHQPRPYEFLALQLLAAAVFVSLVVFFSIREEYWADEGFSTRRVEATWAQIYNPFAVKPAENASPFDTRYVYDFNPPFYFALIRTLAGPHPDKLVFRIFSILPALAILLLLGSRAYRRFGLPSAAAVLGALTFSPALLYYGHEARPYALATFAALLLILLYDRPPTRAWAVFILNALIAMLGTLTHYHLIWMILSLGALYLFGAIKDPGSRRKSLLSLGGLIAGTAATVLIMLPLRYTISATVSQPSPKIDDMMLAKMIFFPVMSTGGMNHTQLMLTKFVIVLFLITIVASGDGIMRQLSCARLSKLSAWLWLWLAASLAPVLAHAIFGQLYHERYAIFALPAFAMLLGAVVREAWSASRVSRIAASALIVAILANGIYWTAPHLNQPFRPPWSFAIKTMYAREQPGDFYTIQPQWLTLGFAANAGTAPKSTYVLNLESIPPAAKRLWVIEQFNRDRRAEKQLAGSGWKIEPVFQIGVYWVWLAQKSD